MGLGKLKSVITLFNRKNFSSNLNIYEAKNVVGDVLEITKVWTAIPNDGFIYVLVDQQIAASVLLSYTISAGGDCIFESFIGSTLTANGTELTAMNRNLNFDNISASGIYDSPTVTDEGTKVRELYLPGGGGPLSAGFSGSTPGIVLTNIPILAKVTNISGVATDAGVVIDMVR